MKICLRCQHAFAAPGWECPACGFRPPRRGDFYSFADDLDAAPATFCPGAFPLLRQQEERSFWFRGRNRLIQFLVGRHFPGARSLLEVGCGPGGVLAALARAFPGMRLVGGDRYPGALTLAAARLPAARFLQLDAPRLPFDREFDVVGAFDLLEHVADDLAVLRAAHRALNPGGGLVVTVPQHPWLWSPYDALICHQRRYRRAELVGRLAAAGFRVVWVSSFVTLAFPLLVASRWWGRRRPTITPPGLHLPRWLDALLDGLSRLELAAFRRGRAFPWGGSLAGVGLKL